MREFSQGLQPFLAYAAFFSLAVNLLLLAPPLYMLQVFDRVISSRSEETLVALTVATVLALALMAFLDAIRTRLLAAAALALDRKLGPRMLEGVLRRFGGPDFAHALRDVNTLRGFFTGAGVLSLFDAPWLPLFLLIIFLFHPLLGAIALAGAVTMWLLAFVNERLARGPLERVQEAGRRAGRFIDLSARNAEAISALGMLPAVTQRWSRLNEAVHDEQRRAGRIGSRFSGLTKFARQLIQMAMLGAGAWLVLHEGVTAGVMIAATILLGRALAPVEALVAGWKGLVEARGAWRRLDALLAANPPAPPGTELPAPQGELEVANVAFRVIRRVSFRLAAGESLGVIGPSAAGKSTLARLVAGICRPEAGGVRLDGADVAAWPRDKLGPHIGYLPQDVELFPGTVAENIARLGEIDAAAVVGAAQRAHAHDMILRLPKGYDTEIGEAVSPGQRQRIALARALYGNPRLVVLDEPNANLDAEGDHALVRALAGLKEEGVTVIVIAHRPSLLGGMDRMLVLREGLVERFGPRAEIMREFTRVAA